MDPIAELAIGLLILSNGAQLAISIHDRRAMLDHSAKLALANARKTITMSDSSKDLRKIAMKMIRLEDIRLALLSATIPRALEDSTTLDAFSRMDSERLLEIAEKLDCDSSLGANGCIDDRSTHGKEAPNTRSGLLR